MNRLELGICVGPDLFAASWANGRCEKILSGGPTADAVHAAISELRQTVGPRRRVSVTVAILPPLARVRRIELPRMSEGDRQLAVTTNAQRYFIGLEDPLVCGATAVRTRSRGRKPSLLAFAASSMLVENVKAGIESAGWKLNRIVPAQAAWASWATHRSTHRRLGQTSVGVRLPTELNFLELEAGRLSRVRRLRAAADFARVTPLPPVQLIGAVGAEESAAVVAAEAARIVKGYELVPESLRRARSVKERQLAALLMAFACMAILAAAVGFRWQLERRLSAIEARRSAMQSRVSEAVASRESMQRVVDQVAAIRELERSAPRWSAVLSRIALALPEDAELSSVRADADSMIVEGQSPDVSRVLSALRKTPGVRTARAAAPIVRESAGDKISLEEWRLALRVDHGAAVAHR